MHVIKACEIGNLIDIEVSEGLLNQLNCNFLSHFLLTFLVLTECMKKFVNDVEFLKTIIFFSVTKINELFRLGRLATYLRRTSGFVT